VGSGNCHPDRRERPGGDGKRNGGNRGLETGDRMGLRTCDWTHWRFGDARGEFV
jgi:hypothetical protein